MTNPINNINQIPKSQQVSNNINNPFENFERFTRKDYGTLINSNNIQDTVNIQSQKTQVLPGNNAIENKKNNKMKYAFAAAAIAFGVGAYVKRDAIKKFIKGVGEDVENSQTVQNSVRKIKKLAIEEIEFLKTELGELNKKHPDDINYRKKLVESLNKGVDESGKIEEYHLCSIVGKNEFEDIVKGLKPENFSTGNKFSNVEKGIFTANLHNHTDHSDGLMSVEELLNMSARYGDKLSTLNKSKFFVAVTDHDTVEGCKKALELISSDPIKYKNVKLVLGTEISTIYRNSEMLAKPINTVDCLAYCIDPYQEKLAEKLNSLRGERINNSKTLINEINKQNKNEELSWEEARDFHPNIGRGITNGTPYLIKNYANYKLVYNASVQKAGIKDKKDIPTFIECAKSFYEKNIKPDIPESFFKHFKEQIPEIKAKIGENTALEEIFGRDFKEKLDKTGNICLKNLPKITGKIEPPIAIDVSDAIKLVGNKEGVVGVAHPGLIGVDGTGGWNKSFTDTHGSNSGKEFINRFLQDFNNNAQKENLKVAGEAHYQYYKTDNSHTEWINTWNNAIVARGFIQTGSLDSHSNNIFSNRTILSESVINKLVSNGYKEIMEKYPKDHEYRLQLVKELKDKYNVDATAENLRSIVGVQELKDIIGKLKPEHFSTGDLNSTKFEEIYKNALEGNFRVSLHAHTTHSDGRLKVEQFLDQSAQYADKVAKLKKDTNEEIPPFIIAITDHDAIEGSQEAISIIAKNPEKYKNLRFVAGAEISTVHSNPAYLKKQCHFDLIPYCINPFNADINNLLESMKKKREESASQILEKINGQIENKEIKFSLDKIMDDPDTHRLVRTGRGTGFLYELKNYVEKQLKVLGLKDKLQGFINETFQGKPEADSPNAADLINMVKSSGQGLIGVAHPRRINIGDYLADKENKGFSHGIYLLFRDLKGQGLEAAESNYQYRSKYWGDELNQTNQVCFDLQLIRTGGQDSHRSIFAHHEKIQNDQLKKLLEMIQA